MSAGSEFVVEQLFISSEDIKHKQAQGLARLQVGAWSLKCILLGVSALH